MMCCRIAEQFTECPVPVTLELCNVLLFYCTKKKVLYNVTNTEITTRNAVGTRKIFVAPKHDKILVFVNAEYGVIYNALSYLFVTLAQHV